MKFEKFKKTKIGAAVFSVLRKCKKRYILHSRRKNEKQIYKKGKQPEKHIFYCGICESSNMGDMAQTYCTLKWMEKYYPDYDIIPCKTSIIMDPRCSLVDTMKKVVRDDDLIFFQSGYNTHDIEGSPEDFMHQKIISAFPNTVTIMLPQTVYFQTEKRRTACSEIYNAHKKMLFLARDPISEATAKEMFPSLTVKCFPDIVTSLIGKYEYSNPRSEIYLCRRCDPEQFWSEEDYKEFEKALSSLDRVDVSDTIISATNKEIFSDLEKYVNNIIEHFAHYKLVVTDKYHGLIFSLVAATPVIVLKTKDHKVVSGYEWFSKIYKDRVFYAESSDEISAIAKRILENPSYTKLDEYFDREYYKKLYDIICNWESELKS